MSKKLKTNLDEVMSGIASSSLGTPGSLTTSAKVIATSSFEIHI
jgi:hypothetical protein